MGRQRAEPGQLEEARVDDRALVGVDAAVAEVVDDGGVRVAGAREPDEVARRVRAARRDRPALDRALEVVGGGEVELRAVVVVLDRGDPPGRDEPGDLGRDRRRRVAALLLPALVAERRPARDEEVVALGVRPASADGHRADPGHDGPLARDLARPAPGVLLRDLTPPATTAALLPKLALQPGHFDWIEPRVGRYPSDAYGTLAADADFGFLALEPRALTLFGRDALLEGEHRSTGVSERTPGDRQRFAARAAEAQRERGSEAQLRRSCTTVAACGALS